MADSFEIKHGDTLPVMPFTLYSDDAKTTPVDLTNATTVTVKVGAGPVWSETAEIVTPATGACQYKFKLADWTTLTPMEYDMEFQVDWNNGDVSTYPLSGHKKLKVNADLDT